MRFNRNHIVVIFAATLFVACSSPENDELEKLSHQLDSLKSLRNDINDQIVDIELTIAELDTNIDKKLVTTFSPRSGLFKHYFEVYGNVQTDRMATIFAENQGTIEQIRVREGEKVQKGQILVEQDHEIIDRNIEELQTQLELATTLYEKQERLWEQNVGSEVQYLEAKNRKESLESSMATLREQRNKATIKAPFAGVVDKVFPKLGELVGMQSPVVRLVNLDELYITADVSERYAGEINEGDTVDIILNRRDTVSSQIARIGSYVNPTNRTFEVKVSLGNGKYELRPNSLVVLRINDHSEPGALIIPTSVVMQDGKGENYVFVVQPDSTNATIARKRPITLGMSYLGEAVVKSGIESNEEIVDKGSRSLRDGDRIEKTEI